jgi:hypothetical protein
MEISELTLKLIIILVPGALGTLIMSKLTIRKDFSPFNFILNSILLGLFSYLLVQLTLNCIYFINNSFSCSKRTYDDLQIWSSISDSKLIPYKEVLWASLGGIILGFIASYLDTYKLINKLAKKLKISYKYGDENLFSYFLNADETQVVYVRDKKNNLSYRGYVKVYSETDTISEIVLSNVTVYRYEDSVELYEIDQVYLSFGKTDVIIEHAKLLENGEKTETESQTT